MKIQDLQIPVLNQHFSGSFSRCSRKDLFKLKHEIPGGAIRNTSFNSIAKVNGRTSDHSFNFYNSVTKV